MSPTPDLPSLPAGSGLNAAVIEYRHIHISEDPDSIETGPQVRGLHQVVWELPGP